jgi:SHS2 domain-containing protein
MDPARHPRGTVVKAATFQGLEVVQTPGQVSVRVILNI